jgi:hypothetical protein
MKIKFKIYFTILALGTVLFLCGQVSAYDIEDNYWGADDHGYGDLIEASNTDNFDIFGADVTLDSGKLTVSIFTQFAGKSGGLFADYTEGDTGIGYGDLFLSSNWTPKGNAGDHYVNDNYYSTPTTTWEYAVTLGDRFTNPASDGDAAVFQLNGHEPLLSDDFMTGATYRNGQEVALDFDHPENLALIDDDAKWWVGSDSINFEFALIPGMENWDEIAIHWGETCANDVIEGSVPNPVPEPATMLLLGTGLIGLAGIGRKKSGNKKI